MERLFKMLMKEYRGPIIPESDLKLLSDEGSDKIVYTDGTHAICVDRNPSGNICKKMLVVYGRAIDKEDLLPIEWVYMYNDQLHIVTLLGEPLESFGDLAGHSLWDELIEDDEGDYYYERGNILINDLNYENQFVKIDDKYVICDYTNAELLDTDMDIHDASVF